MQRHERRTSQGFPYYKLAEYDPISMCFRDGKRAYATAAEARAAARKPGKYRLSVVLESGRQDMEVFEPCRGGRISRSAGDVPK